MLLLLLINVLQVLRYFINTFALQPSIALTYKFVYGQDYNTKCNTFKLKTLYAEIKQKGFFVLQYA